MAINELGRDVQVNALGTMIDRISNTQVVPDGAKLD